MAVMLRTVVSILSSESGTERSPQLGPTTGIRHLATTEGR